MASETGTRQVVVLGQSDSVSFRLLDEDGEEIPITSVTSVEMSDPSGAPIAHGGVTSFSGSLATLIFTVAPALFSVGEGYGLLWNLNGPAYSKKAFFDVAARDFASQLSDSDLLSAHPGLVLPTGLSSFAPYRQRAWRRIERATRKALRASPHLLFYPEDFFDCHLAFSLAEYFRPNAFSGDRESWTKYRDYQREGRALFNEVLANLDYDADGDGLKGSGDVGHDLRGFLEREFD